jgi:glycosyltransferase involved in cell wall biosynthesis
MCPVASYTSIPCQLPEAAENMVGSKKSTNRLRVLILADDCNPEWPSLPVVAYKYARAIADYADAAVVTQIRNKPNLERTGLGRAKVIYLDTENIAAPLNRLGNVLGGRGVGWTTRIALAYPSYLYFEYMAWKRCRQELLAGNFDLVHRVSPMSPTTPSYFATVCPVPFLLGPVNGSLPWPEQFQSELAREREWLSLVRGLHKFLPFYRTTYKKAAAVLAAFDHTISDLSVANSARILNFPEVGIDPELFSLGQRSQQSRKTILFAGRLVPYKLPEVLVRAFAASPILQQHRLVFVGDGPERPRLESLVAQHDLADCVELLGQQPQQIVGQLMQQADIFAFPSIRELGAGVVVEAMASGLACVVVDYGAPGTLIESSRGVKIPINNFERLVQDFTSELERLVTNPDRIAQLGLAAHQHVMTYYRWDTKAQKTLEIYNWLLNSQQEKPDFWQPSGDSLLLLKR